VVLPAAQSSSLNVLSTTSRGSAQHYSPSDSFNGPSFSSFEREKEVLPPRVHFEPSSLLAQSLRHIPSSTRVSSQPTSSQPVSCQPTSWLSARAHDVTNVPVRQSTFHWLIPVRESTFHWLDDDVYTIKQGACLTPVTEFDTSDDKRRLNLDAIWKAYSAKCNKWMFALIANTPHGSKGIYSILPISFRAMALFYTDLISRAVPSDSYSVASLRASSNRDVSRHTASSRNVPLATLSSRDDSNYVPLIHPDIFEYIMNDLETQRPLIVAIQPPASQIDPFASSRAANNINPVYSQTSSSSHSFSSTSSTSSSPTSTIPLPSSLLPPPPSPPSPFSSVAVPTIVPLNNRQRKVAKRKQKAAE
jgi:hypothetical protein